MKTTSIEENIKILKLKISQQPLIRYSLKITFKLSVSSSNFKLKMWAPNQNWKNTSKYQKWNISVIPDRIVFKF